MGLIVKNASYGPRVVTNGLVLNLDAGNRKSYPGSGTTWTDLSGNSSYPIPMNCASFKVYNRALTTSEIQKNYIASKSRFGL